MIFGYEIETAAPAWAVWQVWEDVARWKEWSLGLEQSRIVGAFTNGAKGTITPKKAPEIAMELVQVVPMVGFTSKSKLFLSQIIVSHSLEDKQSKTVVTHRVEIQGPLAFFFSFVIGRKMKKNLPRDMRNFVKKAEALAEQRG